MSIVRVSSSNKGNFSLGKGNTTAVVTSLRTFDREEQKVYFVPILIQDGGQPAMTGTSTLTVVIGDLNDNLMAPGSKEILVYNYMVRLTTFIIVHTKQSTPLNTALMEFADYFTQYYKCITAFSSL